MKGGSQNKKAQKEKKKVRKLERKCRFEKIKKNYSMREAAIKEKMGERKKARKTTGINFVRKYESVKKKKEESKKLSMKERKIGRMN